MGDWYSGKGAQAGVDETCDIHCIVHDENAYLQTGPNMKRGIEAHRKMDFVLSKAQFLTTQALYSDIVLPVTTQWEVPGGLDSSNREFLLPASRQVTEPLYEAKTEPGDQHAASWRRWGSIRQPSIPSARSRRSSTRSPVPR